MFQVEVPAGVSAGDEFQVSLAGSLMVITCPAGCGPGSVIQASRARSRPCPLFHRPPSLTARSRRAQVAAPAMPPTVTGVPVSSEAVAGSGIPGSGIPGVVPGVTIVEGPQMIEVDEISPAGWFCLIVGCFMCPGFNLLGLCMRERRLVPASSVWHY